MVLPGTPHDRHGPIAEGNANPAQEVLGEHAIHGHELPKSLKILAIDTELDRFLGSGAFPNNEFFNQMVPFLDGIGG